MEQQFINIDPQQLQLLLLVAVIATVGAILIAVIAIVVLIAMTLRIASEMRTEGLVRASMSNNILNRRGRKRMYGRVGMIAGQHPLPHGAPRK